MRTCCELRNSTSHQSDEHGLIGRPGYDEDARVVSSGYDTLLAIFSDCESRIRSDTAKHTRNLMASFEPTNFVPKSLLCQAFRIASIHAHLDAEIASDIPAHAGLRFRRAVCVRCDANRMTDDLCDGCSWHDVARRAAIPQRQGRQEQERHK